MVSEVVTITGPGGERFIDDDDDDSDYDDDAYDEFHKVENTKTCMYNPVTRDMEKGDPGCRMPVPDINRMRSVGEHRMDSVDVIEENCPDECICTADWADCGYDENKGKTINLV